MLLASEYNITSWNVLVR